MKDLAKKHQKVFTKSIALVVDCAMLTWGITGGGLVLPVPWVLGANEPHCFKTVFSHKIGATNLFFTLGEEKDKQRI